MQYIVWAVHDGGLLSLLALYTRLEWIYLYVLCFLFSVMLFDCFVFFWLILLISIFALFCCDNISVVELPRFEQFLILSVRFVGLFGLQSFWLLVVFLVLFSCTLFAFFLAIFMLFPIFWILFTHVTPCSSAYFACFLLFHSRMHHGISTDTWGVPGHLYHSPKISVTVVLWRLTTLPAIFAPHIHVTNMFCSTIYVSFCLVIRSACT